MSLRYWPSELNFNEFNKTNMSSGTYIFNPQLGVYHSIPYTEFLHGTVSHSRRLGQIDSQMVLYFGKSAEWASDETTWLNKARVAIVKISLDRDLPTIRFDVDLGSLPGPRDGGTEVTVNFRALNFDNKGVFYTDSNGLEMQRRELNYRPTWNISDNYADGNTNITANFYPVDSAISIRDGSRQFTVLNDRSQAGSSLEPGRVEFMQNRVVPADDGKGMHEIMAEEDPATGRRIRVSAAYHVMFGEAAASRQRKMQKRIDEPTQMLFSNGPLFEHPAQLKKHEPTLSE